MKKAVILTILMALAFNGLFANQKRETASDFFEVYQETLELNKDRFADINLIQVGDTVLLPSLFVGDPTIYRWIADEPMNGKHDCIWLISERYFFQNISKPMIVEPVEEKKSTEPEEMAKNFPYLLLLGVIAILLLLGYIFQRLSKSEAVNPNAQPAMIRNGLSPDNQAAIRQIARQENIDPENITKTERLMLVRNSGPQRVEVMMDFRNGAKKSYVLPGELVTRVTIEENGETRIEYWRNHCGNRFGTIKEGQFELPAGWEAFIQNTYNNPEARVNIENEEIVPVKIATNVSAAPAAQTDIQSIATIISNLPKGVAKVEIKPDGTIAIEMNSNKKK
jgi:hypothetical protein